MTPSPLLLKAVRESRADISLEYIALCSELDIQKKIKKSFKQHPFLWLGGAAGAGFLTTLFGSKPSEARTKHPAFALNVKNAGSSLSKIGWWAGALEVGKMLYPMLRPVVLEFAKKTIESTLAKKNNPH